MPLPELTHLQFLVLSIIGGTEKAGREIRAQLAGQGTPKTGPAFYQLMSRLEDSSLVRGWYESKVVDGQTLKERRYRVTAAGIKAWEATREFYDERSTLELEGGGGHA